MPFYMDIHDLPGITPEQLAQAHAADLETQRKYGVKYQKYWVNHECGKVFCLAEAPNAAAAEQVHREAHGFVAEKMIEVQPEVVEAFLGGGETHASGAVLLPSKAAEARDPGIRTILFTDIVSSTLLTQRLGDEAAMELLGRHDTIVRGALTAAEGREIKHLGDGIMASFASAAGAVSCASQIQHEVARLEPRDLRIRIGAAAGEPIEHANDIFGSTVQLAARLCAHAAPSEILVSNVVAELCLGKRLSFRALGGISLKGFEDPITVHAVEWCRGAMPSLFAVDLSSRCRHTQPSQKNAAGVA
jgi:class 3 adenylate cyclase